MIRLFLRHSLIYVIPSAVSSGLALILFPLYAHHFQPHEYGVLEILTFSGTFVILVGALQMYQAVGRFVTGESDRDVRRAYASTGLHFSLAWYGVLAALILLFATPVASALLGQPHEADLVRIAIAWTAAQGVLTFAQSQLRWELRPLSYASATVINAVFTAVPAAVLVFYLHLGLRGALWGQLIGSTIALGYVLVASRGGFAMSFSRARLREMLAYSTPLVVSNVGMFLNLYADRLLIQHLESLSAVGVYAVGSRVATLITLLLVGFQGAATPLFLSKRDEAATPAAIARIFRLFVVVGFSAVIALSVLAVPLVRLAAASAYQHASRVVPLLVVSALFSGIGFFAPGILFAKKTMLAARITVIAGAANAVLCLVLIPPLGIVGAAVATCSTSIGWFVVLMIASQRFYPVPHEWRSLALGAAAVAAYVAACLALLPAAPGSALRPALLVLRVLLVVAPAGAICLAFEAQSVRAVLASTRPTASLLAQRLMMVPRR